MAKTPNLCPDNCFAYARVHLLRVQRALEGPTDDEANRSALRQLEEAKEWLRLAQEGPDVSEFDCRHFLRAREPA